MKAKKGSRRVLFHAVLVAFVLVSWPVLSQAQAGDPLTASLEAARRTRDESQLQLLKTQLDQRISQNPNDAQAQYQLA